MQEIKIKKITTLTVECFDSNNNSLGFINEYEFHDLRVQIKYAKAEGYYCVFNNEKLLIDINGRLSIWPDGFFDAIENSLMYLL